jgi:exopolyphosphatase/guanosine-5'-triphosphate,3'-diphosphate pyrophosphatase
MMSKIRGMDYEARRNNPCIGRDRADLVLAGCAIFEAIRQEWPCKRLRVADRGLREGILVQLMRADGYLRGAGRDARPESPRL